jgi:crotonobetainyl-CoA:carnitine CoA-transferase CaiB-like acyl-CoA transferase
MALLGAYRVLDPTDERGLPAGRWLADLGADVVQVEPPGGSPGRRAGARPGTTGPTPYWTAYTHNKRSITCDLTTSEGVDLARRLAARADVVIESAGHGVLAALGLGYDQLRTARPELVYTSITPFGPDGEKAGYRDSDLILWAAGGALNANLTAGRPATRVSAPMQSYLHAAADAAVGTLLALTERASSGRGQRVDVSVQASVTVANFKLGMYPLVNARPPSGNAASGSLSPGAPLIWATKDGYVHLSLTAGPLTGHFTNTLLDWLHEQGALGDDFPAVDYRLMPQTSGSGMTASAASSEPTSTAHVLTPDQQQDLYAAISDFLLTRTSSELFAAARARGLLISPIYRVDQVLQDEQLHAREAWFEHPEYTVPGPMARFDHERIEDRRLAPSAGQHNGEIYAELGLDAADIDRLTDRGVL